MHPGLHSSARLHAIEVGTPSAAIGATRHDPHLPAGASPTTCGSNRCGDIVFLAPHDGAKPWAIAACRGRHVVADKLAAATARAAITAARGRGCRREDRRFGRLLDALAAFGAPAAARAPRLSAAQYRSKASSGTLAGAGAPGDLGSHRAVALLAIDTGWRVDRSSVSVDESGAIVAATAAFLARKAAAADVALKERDATTSPFGTMARACIEHFSNPLRMTLAISAEVAIEATPNDPPWSRSSSVVAMVETACGTRRCTVRPSGGGSGHRSRGAT